MRLPVGFEILRETLTLRYYRLYVLGNITSNLGTWIQRVAMGWLTWELTHSTTWLGINAIAESGPSILIGLFAGAVIDRVDQFKLLRLAQLWSLIYSSAFAILTITGVINIWMLTGLVLLRGVVIAFYRPTRSTVIYGLVGREFLPSALALNSMVFNTSRFVGPAIGGAIIAWAGTGWSFVVSFCLFCVMTLALREIKKAGLSLPPVSHVRHSIWQGTKDGIRYILNHDGIRLQLTLLIVTSLVAKPLTDLMPGFAGQVYNRGSSRPCHLAHLRGHRRDDRRLLDDLALGIARPHPHHPRQHAAARDRTVTVRHGSQFLHRLLYRDGHGLCFHRAKHQQPDPDPIRHPAGDARPGDEFYGIIAQSVPSIGTLTMGWIAAQAGLRWPIAVGGALCALLWAWSWRLRKPLAAALEDRTDRDRCGRLTLHLTWANLVWCQFS